MRIQVIIIIALVLCVNPISAITIHIPGDYPTIQAGIEAAVDGDTVLVASGVYQERIFFLGKEIVLISESGPDGTVIDPNQMGCAVNFIEAEGIGAVVEGFTISNSYYFSTGWYSGVRCSQGSAPIIRDNIIANNGGLWALQGGGICAEGASPLIEKNQIINNECVYYGGGIYLDDCEEARILNNIISGNYVFSGYGMSYGGGIYAQNSAAVIEGNIIAGNWTDPDYSCGGGITIWDSVDCEIVNNTISTNIGAGVLIYMNSVVSFTDNILVNSTLDGGLAIGYGSPVVQADFNDIWNNFPSNYVGCHPGPFDISEDPQLTGGPLHNYYLSETSPCIDAGSFTAELDPDGTRTDMGASYFDRSSVNVAIVPDEWPINIPSIGGSFSFTLHVTNHTADTQLFDFWVDVMLPDSAVHGPIILREGISFDPNQSIARETEQAVPGNAPPGEYLYMAHTGDYSTHEVYHETLMPFHKEGF